MNLTKEEGCTEILSTANRESLHYPPETHMTSIGIISVFLYVVGKSEKSLHLLSFEHKIE